VVFILEVFIFLVMRFALFMVLVEIGVFFVMMFTLFVMLFEVRVFLMEGFLFFEMLFLFRARFALVEMFLFPVAWLFVSLVLDHVGQVAGQRTEHHGDDGQVGQVLAVRSSLLLHDKLLLE
jgi:hypothetical protein